MGDMVTHIRSATIVGTQAIPIDVEVDISGSWPGFQIIGLPDASIHEAKDRIRSAWKYAGLSFPHSSRIVVNLAPAHIKKKGSSFDLPIAIGMHISHTDKTYNIDTSLFVGELTLDGHVRHVRGILPITLAAKAQGCTHIFVPKENALEASVVPDMHVFGISTLAELIAHLDKSVPMQPTPPYSPPIISSQKQRHDFTHIYGQCTPKRALEIAAVGGHNIRLIGPPGSGKTALAKAFQSILPPLGYKESIETSCIHSIAGLLGNTPLILHPPFRSPHHSASTAAIIGGGTTPKPGEISLAHNGVLFIDELPECSRQLLESLRQPLEDGEVTISRQQGAYTFPANCMFVVSQNPCPCGFAKHEEDLCICSAMEKIRYEKKLSGPLLDRIDLHVQVPKVPLEHLSTSFAEESSAQILKRVAKAREVGKQRNPHGVLNASLNTQQVKTHCNISSECKKFYTAAASLLNISARSYFRTLKVARTIADLEERPSIEKKHISEALQYR
jgi:magnesium chelatase family protein